MLHKARINTDLPEKKWWLNFIKCLQYSGPCSRSFYMLMKSVLNMASKGPVAIINISQIKKRRIRQAKSLTLSHAACKWHTPMTWLRPWKEGKRKMRMKGARKGQIMFPKPLTCSGLSGGGWIMGCQSWLGGLERGNRSAGAWYETAQIPLVSASWKLGCGQFSCTNLPTVLSCLGTG